ncbi:MULTISPECIES: SHOCT domain-containing protein [unclassified Clostridium]|uniref:SHOCT domain-containing protein n=1 Tax=unclassified Clostridium TaxID=2614128 RepID=UPI0025C66CBE|nr:MULTISPECIES: SHOCT domain-containing protein [unclassified Clostridium]
MGAKNKVIDGEYNGKNVIITALGITIVTGLFKKVMIDENTVEKYEIFDSEKKTSATSAIGRGVAGSLFLGPVGLLAVASAKKKGVYVIAIEFKDGKRSLLEVDEKIYRKMLLLNFRNEDRADEVNLCNSSQEDILEQIKKLSELKDQGILTEEEFTTKKTDLLAKL